MKSIESKNIWITVGFFNKGLKYFGKTLVTDLPVSKPGNQISEYTLVAYFGNICLCKFISLTKAEWKDRSESVSTVGP